MGAEKGGPLTSDGQFALSSELGRLMRIDRIARQGALYDASTSAPAFDGVDQVIQNPIDFEEIVNVNLASPAGNFKFPHVQGYGEFLARKWKYAHRVHLL